MKKTFLAPLALLILANIGLALWACREHADRLAAQDALQEATAHGQAMAAHLDGLGREAEEARRNLESSGQTQKEQELRYGEKILGHLTQIDRLHATKVALERRIKDLETALGERTQRLEELEGTQRALAAEKERNASAYATAQEEERSKRIVMQRNLDQSRRAARDQEQKWKDAAERLAASEAELKADQARLASLQQQAAGLSQGLSRALWERDRAIAAGNQALQALSNCLHRLEPQGGLQQENDRLREEIDRLREKFKELKDPKDLPVPPAVNREGSLAESKGR